MDYKALMSTLEKKGYHPYFAATKEEAKEIVMGTLLKGVKTLGKGGSVTLQQCGIWDALLEQDEITVYATTLAGMRGESKKQAMIDAMTADAYICSTNALTTAGDIINIDGIGNRVAS
ncbi:MAG: LUD domain-containing protein, partial [Christensenellaceae bacterium]|nr:LUD domain-containing protein [Christensenellaceae bacterium]